MVQIADIARSLTSQPGYTLMRGAARFAAMRRAVAATRSALQGARLRRHLADCEQRLASSVFPGLDRVAMVQQLRDDGIAFGLRLPAPLVAEIRAHAAQTPCYADRNPAQGFRVADHARAGQLLGKPLLLGQYFNAATECGAIRQLMADPALQWVAGSYLQSLPTFVGANLWWTFPVPALESDRHRHAHLYHRDVDDFSFFKFFFYLTDVQPGDGAHVCVLASHRKPPLLRAGDRWNLRRYTDEEIAASYSAERILEICGTAGTGFAENTLCVHKGRTPTTAPRLLLQLQYALFDYGVVHDRRPPAALHMLA
jgi:hypothetical protein